MNANTITGPQYGTPREMPWNVMGKALSVTSTTNLDVALAEAGLDYQVRTLPVFAHEADGLLLSASKSRAVVRPTPDGDKVVGMVGTRYTPIQNAEAFSIAQDLIGFGAMITGLADFRHGGASVMAVDLGRPVVLDRPDGGTDTIDLNLLVKNAHDGSSALTFALTPMRLACTNALQASIKTAERSWKISHTPNAMERVSLAEQAIKEAIGYHDAFQAEAQRMMDLEMVDAEFAKIVSNLWKVDPEATGKVAERKRDTQDQVMDLYLNSPTLEGIRGTRWGGYNALTEYLDHYRPVKGDAVLARAEGALEGPNVRAKGKVWNLMAV